MTIDKIFTRFALTSFQLCLATRRTKFFVFISFVSRPTHNILRDSCNRQDVVHKKYIWESEHIGPKASKSPELVFETYWGLLSFAWSHPMIDAHDIVISKSTISLEFISLFHLDWTPTFHLEHNPTCNLPDQFPNDGGPSKSFIAMTGSF